MSCHNKFRPIYHFTICSAILLFVWQTVLIFSTILLVSNKVLSDVDRQIPFQFLSTISHLGLSSANDAAIRSCFLANVLRYVRYMLSQIRLSVCL